MNFGLFSELNTIKEKRRKTIEKSYDSGFPSKRINLSPFTKEKDGREIWKRRERIEKKRGGE
jgi:hypothetical protein